MGRRGGRTGSKNKARRWVAILSAVAVVACIGLFVRAYHRAGAGPAATGSIGSSGIAAAPSPTPSRTPSSTSRNTGPSVVVDPQQLPQTTIFPKIPGGFTFGSVPHHVVVLTVTSSAPIGRLGYLVPTSQDHSSGDVRNVGTFWTLTTTAYGKPYYAAIFIAVGASGAAITCSISVDGVVKDRRTASRSSTRQVCAA